MESNCFLLVPPRSGDGACEQVWRSTKIRVHFNFVPHGNRYCVKVSEREVTKLVSETEGILVALDGVD